MDPKIWINELIQNGQTNIHNFEIKNLNTDCYNSLVTLLREQNLA